VIGPDIGASIRARLLAKAKAGGQDFNLVLTRYALERLLYRPGACGYAEICNRRVSKYAASFCGIVSVPRLRLLQKSNQANGSHVLAKDSYSGQPDFLLCHCLLIHLTMLCSHVRGFSISTLVASC